MDVIRELNLNYATVEKDLTRFISRLTHLNGTESDFAAVGEFHAASQIESNYEKTKLQTKIKNIRNQVQDLNNLISSLEKPESETNHSKFVFITLD